MPFRAAVGLALVGLAVAPASGIEIAPTRVLVVGPMAAGGRTLLQGDPVQERIVAGAWRPPHEGETVEMDGGGQRTWRELEAGKDGLFQSRALAPGYACAAAQLAAPRVMLLEAAGHSMVYVNGTPHAGDPYEHGYVRLPVALTAGRNALLFSCGRGRLRVRLVDPPAPVLLDTGDLTLPDLIRGRTERLMGAVVVVNASTEPREGLVLAAGAPKSGLTRTRLPWMPPLSVRKVGFALRVSPPRGGGQALLALSLLDPRGRTLHAAQGALRVREPRQTWKRTFVSGIDGSVQYYAVNPACPPPGAPAGRPALVLSLHGASVEAIGNADAYAPKTWAHIVCPTNRRPYGFDWEDWGRADAMEVLEEARRTLRTDPARTYLTGHSMGGHGVWHIAATYPDRFAAIGPSAAWISFQSYAGGARLPHDDRSAAIFRRAGASSNTLALAPNYRWHGVYILHGGADDNVPVTEARAMAALLATNHHDWQYHEQPGAGHWWESSDEPGAECMDWPPMFDMFARHALPPDAAVRDVRFVTVNPGVSARCHWATVEEQQRPLQPSTIDLRRDPHRRRFTGTTTNVALLAIDAAGLPEPATVSFEIDGQELGPARTPAHGGVIRLRRAAGAWSIAGDPDPFRKGPRRSGPFKLAFDHRVLLVWGTVGSPEEAAWAEARARLDAETLWYRGNASVEAIPDTAFRPERERDRGVVLYGNADTNRAWSALLGQSPVQVRRGEVRVGGRVWKGSDLACLFLRPRPGSDVACVAAVAGSGPVGMRLTDRLPYLVPGVAVPDCLVVGPEILSRGDAGVRTVGLFGADWSVEGGEFAGAGQTR
ncbi:MAG: prolyl oligopeptidase family serine peptidase [Chthonomonadales bacterium]|nr:prolyl oligopeptidase family serine peptidase [Chthonomonadales bacterium]